MKKKITLLVLCLMMSFTFLLAGCDLFPRNQTEYLNRTVATLEYKDGTVDKITTKHFINAYNSYGYSLVQNGTEIEDALEQTMQVLINRRVMLNEAKKNVDIEPFVREILNETYESVVSNIESFEDEVETEWYGETPEDESSEDKKVVYEEYKQKAKVVVVDGEYKIELIEEEDVAQTKNFKTISEVVDAVMNVYYNDNSNVTATKIKKEAFRRYVAVLKANEKGLNLSTNVKDVFERQVKDVYTNVEENKYITELENYYKVDGKYSTISVEQVLEKYKSLMLTSKFTYDNDAEAYKKAVLENFDEVYYVSDDKFFNVSHFLIKFDDAQQQAYNKLTEKRKNGELLPSEYELELNSLVADIKANVRNTESGEIEQERAVSAQKVLADLKNELAKAKTNEEKDAIFSKYIYTYNEDDGIMNAEYAYVVGTEESKMVESFTAASRDLHDAGEYGAISDLVVSEYGVHVVYYIGTLENQFNVDNITEFELKASDIEVLTQTKLNALNNKTLFDKVFEDLSEDNYSIFENMNLNVLKSAITITDYPDVYKNLD
ncbi:MAG: hypothetical protein IJA69_03315 [Clostridia bacterium]|nr:hypothetical protein [Clostridia bacterium]